MPGHACPHPALRPPADALPRPQPTAESASCPHLLGDFEPRLLQPEDGAAVHGRGNLQHGVVVVQAAAYVGHGHPLLDGACPGSDVLVADDFGSNQVTDLHAHARRQAKGKRHEDRQGDGSPLFADDVIACPFENPSLGERWEQPAECVIVAGQRRDVRKGKVFLCTGDASDKEYLQNVSGNL